MHLILDNLSTLILWVAWLCPTGLHAAVPFSSECAIETNLHKGTLLFDQGEYTTAQACFEACPNHATYFQEEMAYGRALSALAHQDVATETILQRFIVWYPKSKQTDNVRYQLAHYLFEKGELLKSLSCYKAIHPTRLDAKTEKVFPYALAHAYLALQDWPNAKKSFTLIQDVKNPYYYPAQLNLAYIAYAQGDYPQAMMLLDEAEKSMRYTTEVRRLTIYVLHASGDHEALLAYVKNQSDASLTHQEKLFVADAYFFLEQYASAIPYYQACIEHAANGKQTAHTKLVHALYKTKRYAEALACCQQMMEGKDLSAQVGAYYGGLIYEREKALQPALDCFTQAAAKSFDKQLQERACINQAALLCQQGSISKAMAFLTDFIEAHPKSSHLSAAQTLLVKCLYATQKYEEAIKYIMALPYKNEALLTLYQQVLFYQGLETYNQGAAESALDHLKQSMCYPFDPSLLTSAMFWMAESFASLEAYDDALSFYTQCLKQPDGLKVAHYAQAVYGLAYAYFNKGQYPEATKSFEQYLALNHHSSAATHYDATLRLGDCYYVQKRYEQALQCYERVYSYHPARVRYQEALIYEAQGNPTRATQCIEEVIAQHAQTKYGLKARYQEACMVFNRSNYKGAIQKFSQLIQQEPYSSLQPDFRMKRALAYENLQQSAEAIADYVAIVEKYPTHIHAESALMALTNLFAAQGTPEKIEPYVQYHARVMQPSDRCSDAQMIDRATSLFYSQAYTKVIQQLNAFVKRHARSPLLPKAYFLLAESYYRTKQINPAVHCYKKVTASNHTALHAKAWLRLAELAYQNRQWQEALNSYQHAQKLPLNQKEKNLALLGLIRTSFILKQYQSTTTTCLQVVNNGPETPAASIQEARLYLGKLAMQRGAYKDARHHFGIACMPKHTPVAAEAQFLVAQASFKLKEHKTSLQALFVLVKQFPDNAYVDDAFLLMADNYIQLGNFTQAKATLDSIISQSKQKSTIERAKQKKAVVLKKLKKKPEPYAKGSMG
ncbi:MAG TPA: tetratricopeptide repeat protein [Amoebophilaceae bacterium]|jgi:tetratricopeptide (TPR) repeat protein|nr:tetratricopeptide repeat protein [Amoebophilaceae bacterium]